MASKKILIVEGNTPAACQDASRFGQLSQSQNYANVLHQLEPEVQIRVTHPADLETDLFSQTELAEFDGVVFTGSSLHAYGQEPEVTRQIELMRLCFDGGRKIFGSCWGMQVAAVAAGGQVEPNPKGREIGIARRIQLNELGKSHNVFANKDSVFDAVAIHLDHVTVMPEGAEILAFNDMSAVQAMSLTVGDSRFVGVQYHPEFSFTYMALLYRRYHRLMLDEGFASDEDDLIALVEHFQMLDAFDTKALHWRYGIGAGLDSEQARLTEIYNWLQSL